jgi:hypothetical protein
VLCVGRTIITSQRAPGCAHAIGLVVTVRILEVHTIIGWLRQHLSGASLEASPIRLALLRPGFARTDALCFWVAVIASHGLIIRLARAIVLAATIGVVV